MKYILDEVEMEEIKKQSREAGMSEGTNQALLILLDYLNTWEDRDFTVYNWDNNPKYQEVVDTIESLTGFRRRIRKMTTPSRPPWGC